MWILAVVLGACAFLVLLLAIPVDLKLYLERDDGFRRRVRIEWMFGLVGKDLRRGKPKPKKPKKRKRRLPRLRPALSMLHDRAFARSALRFALDIVRMIRVRDLRGEVRFGMPDPADTGLLFGLLAAPAVLANRLLPAEIRIEPDFEGAALKVRFSAHLRVFPIQVIARSIPFLLAPSTVRAGKSMVGAWRK